MEDVNKNLLKYIIDISQNDKDFLFRFKNIFTIKRICNILVINRNKYNYLVRNSQLDIELLKLKEK